MPEKNNKNNNNDDNSRRRSAAQYSCYSCGQKFESLGDMQRHVLIVHLQTGEALPSPSSSSSAANSAAKAAKQTGVA